MAASAAADDRGSCRSKSTTPIIRSGRRCITRTSAAPAKKRTAEFWNERVPKYLGYFERLLAGSGGSWVTGRRLTHVDLSLFQIVAGLRYAFPKRMKAFERRIPGLVDLHDRVADQAEHQGLSRQRPPHRLQRGGHFPALQGTGCLMPSFRDGPSAPDPRSSFRVR